MRIVLEREYKTSLPQMDKEIHRWMRRFAGMLFHAKSAERQGRKDDLLLTDYTDLRRCCMMIHTFHLCVFASLLFTIRNCYIYIGIAFFAILTA